MAYTSDFPFVYLTADVAAFSIQDDALCVLAVKRRNPPHRGRWALPGGFVDDMEDVEKAARRELREETGVDARKLPLEQVGVYTAPRRDPRHRTISVAWLAVLPADIALEAGDDASDARWWPVDELLEPRRLAFDHATILGEAVEQLRGDFERTGRATQFLPEEFTVADLRRVYEVVWDRPLDPGNFQRKVTGMPGLLEDTGYQTAGGRGRPATLYRAGAADAIWPPLSRERDR